MAEQPSVNVRTEDDMSQRKTTEIRPCLDRSESRWLARLAEAQHSMRTIGEDEIPLAD